MAIKELQAYELLREEGLSDIQSVGYLLRHRKSGARIMVYFDEMYVVFPLVVLCELRLHDTSPLFGPRGRHWEVISR